MQIKGGKEKYSKYFNQSCLDNEASIENAGDR